MKGKISRKTDMRRVTALTLAILFISIALAAVILTFCYKNDLVVLPFIVIAAVLTIPPFFILKMRNTTLSFDAGEESVSFSSGVKKRCIPYGKIISVRMDYTDPALDHVSRVAAAYLDSVDEPDRHTASQFKDCLDTAFRSREKFLKELRANGSGSYQASELDSKIIGSAAEESKKPAEQRVYVPKYDDTVKKQDKPERNEDNLEEKLVSHLMDMPGMPFRTVKTTARLAADRSWSDRYKYYAPQFIIAPGDKPSSGYFAGEEKVRPWKYPKDRYNKTFVTEPGDHPGAGRYVDTTSVPVGMSDHVPDTTLRLKMVIELDDGNTVSVNHYVDIKRQRLFSLLENIPRDEFAQLFFYIRKQIKT